jgi:putative N-acetylmannosamine-6-phosphate epimerase
MYKWKQDPILNLCRAGTAIINFGSTYKKYNDKQTNKIIKQKQKRDILQRANQRIS